MSAPRTTAVAERMGRLGTETAFAVSAEANEWRSLGHTVYPFHLGRHGPADPREHRRGGLPRHPRRQDRLLPQRRHPGAARGAGRRRRRLARRRLRAGERRRAARGQAGDREVPAHAHGPGRRSPLPQPRLPDLREPDRVPRRRRQAVRLRARREELPARLRRHRGRHHAAHQAAHLQQPPQPDGGREPGRGDRGAGRARREARSLRALGRGLLGRALLRARASRSRRCRACRSAPSSSTRSARSSP